MTGESDYYSILQVDPGAEKEVIDAAYRRLAAKYHPDVNPSADALERMKQMNAAYDVLSEPRKRAEYDRSRRSTTWRMPPAPRIDGGWRDMARRLLIPAGLLVFMFLTSRMGPRLGFIIAAILVALVYYWLSQSGNDATK
jgi:curved DNA-binding protein CbpA